MGQPVEGVQICGLHLAELFVKLVDLQGVLGQFSKQKGQRGRCRCTCMLMLARPGEYGGEIVLFS